MDDVLPVVEDQPQLQPLTADNAQVPQGTSGSAQPIYKPIPAVMPDPPGLDEITREVAMKKYETLPQMAKAGLEGLSQGIAGPLAPLLETQLGVNPEDIRNRQSVNPGTHIASELAGLVGSSIAGIGLGAGLTKIGDAAKIASEAAGLGKVGSSIARHAIENLAFQSGNEVSKMILKDPDQHVDTAITDMKLATLIGGGFGTISPLWKAASGSKLGSILSSITRKMGGIEGTIPDAINDTLSKTGIDIAPEVRAGLSDDPYVQQMFKTLQQSDTTKSGLALQKSYNEFRKNAGDAIVNTLGKTPDEVEALQGLSKYDAGKTIGETLAKEYQTQLSPIAKSFDELKTRFKSLELPKATLDASGNTLPSITDQIANKIGQASIDEGWAASPSSDIMREVNRTIKELPLQKNLKNLTDYITQVGNNTNTDVMNGPLRRAGSIMTRIMKDAESDVIAKALGETEGPLAVDAFKNARSAYAAQSALKEAIDLRLHVGGSTSGFSKELLKMSQTDGESLLRRLSGSGDADLLNFLQQNYPQTANLVKNWHISELLKKASDKAKPGMLINNESFLTNLNKLSPELRNFIASPEAITKINSIGSVIEEFNKLPHNFSNTARTVDKLLQYIPGTAVGMITLLASHNPVTAILTGVLSKTLGKDVPDAIRLAMLKVMGSAQKVDSDGFKSAVDLIHHGIKGDELVKRATKGIFKDNAEILPQSALPTASDRSKLMKALDKIRQNPEELQNVAGKAGYYLPDQAIAIGRMAATAAALLDQARPDRSKQAAFDTPREPTLADKARYDRVLNIAQQPLLVLQHIKDGTITPGDISIQKTLYPALYNKIAAQLMEEAVKASSKGEIIPYKTRLGMSLYLGQALDSTMTPASIMAAQPKPQGNESNGPKPGTQKSGNALNKLSSMYRTPEQASEQEDLKRAE